MSSSKLEFRTISGVMSWLLLCCLLLLCFLGSYFALEIVPGLNFIFGSIFALLILRYYGLFWALVGALIAGSYTLIIWNNYAYLTAHIGEIIFVGMWQRRTKNIHNMVLPVAWYWATIGSAIVVLMYIVFLSVPEKVTLVVVLKNMINGLTNVVAASLLANVIFFKNRPNSHRLIPMRTVLFNVLGMLLLSATVGMLIINARHYATMAQDDTRAKINSTSAGVLSHLDDWLAVRQHAVNKMADVAAQQWEYGNDALQEKVGIVEEMIPDFGGMYISDAEGVAIAFSPRTNVLGKPLIGVNYSSREYFQNAKRSLKPYVSDVLKSRELDLGKIIVLTAPIVVAGQFVGVVAAAVQVAKIGEFLERHSLHGKFAIAVLDSQGKFVASHNLRCRGKKPVSFAKDRQITPQSTSKIFYRFQRPEDKRPYFLQWRDAWEGASLMIDRVPGWQLMIEEPLYPLHEDMTNRMLAGFLIVLMVSGGALACSFLVTSWIVGPLGKLVDATNTLPTRIFDNREPELPRSAIAEIRQLSDTFRETDTILKRQLEEIRQKRGELERRSLELDGTNQRLLEEFSQRELTQAQLADAKQRAEAASEAKSIFLANMSHEIRTPLGVILGFADILLRQNKGPTLTRYITGITRSGKQLLQLVDDILDLSKVEQGRMKIEALQINLSDWFYETVSDYAVQARDRGLSFSARLAAPFPAQITSDPVRMRQVLVNILGNAFKFTASGSIRIETTALQWSDEFWKLTFRVYDTGTGMNEDEKRRIFKSFVQGDPSTSRKFGGSGLGLTLSRKIARLLGGDVVLVHSSPAVGSCFEFTLTAANSASELVEQDYYVGESRNKEIIEFECSQGKLLCGYRILVIEDSPELREMIELFLVDAGAVVVAVDNGEAAVASAIEQKFDIMLMDIQLPGMSGYEAATAIRKKGCDVKIIALTAHAMSEERDRCLLAGCNEYLSKPVDRQYLINTIARLVNHPAGSSPA